ncbi:hypothetical protein [Motiliproteus sp. SC1-56]|uniref:hypothetical protein n=1 Tax=Motiliproteus sp. SC1-56 TaxID=2799565 RepID=UPI001A8FA9A5|nr:hypothetical protein [Motiliproteus sp. SC1-56]
MPSLPLSLSLSLSLSLVLWLGLVSGAQAREVELSGQIDIEMQHFPETPADPEQHKTYLSLGAEPEWYKQWDGGDNAVVFRPFLRTGNHDSHRDHVDIRELNWLHVGDGWQVRSGISRVFWGVAESQHLVDIINQTDTLEGADDEDRLGQPMVNLTLIRDWGDLSLFWLPYFRERTFAGDEGRLRPQPAIETDRARYESGAEQAHQDFAIRWSHVIGPMDLALSHFSGTSRDPILLAETDRSGNLVLIPFYEQIEQSALELTAVQGDLLWKLEALYRDGRSDDYWAAVGGFEYTLVGVMDTAADLGLLLEYHYDERGEEATSPFQDDLFLGLRMGLNDIQTTEILAGVILDNESDAMLGFVEASSRLDEDFRLSLEWRTFKDLETEDPLFSVRRDDLLLLNLAYFF